jgi:RNA polymerase sigma factor (sigma-70 family)
MVVSQLRRLLGSQQGCTLSDAKLLEDFVARRDEASFEVLVWRHGTMVLSICERILHDAHAAEDAFQATFLVLACKARSIGKGEAVSSWLYKVAFRIALRLRAKASRQTAISASLAELPADEAADTVWRDLRPVLDEEIQRLPEKYRTPFVLCYLQGHTNEEAAEELGCPKGTILSRLARGRERLRSRLLRRGVALSGAGLITALSQNAASASVPATLVDAVVKAAVPFAAGTAAPGLISATVAALTEGELHAMFATKLKIAAAVLLMLAGAGTGTALISHQSTEGRTTDLHATGSLLALGQREERPRPAAEPAAGRERRGDDGRETRPRERPAVQGRITAISDDGKTLTLESGARGEEPTKLTVKLTDKSSIRFDGLPKDVAKKLKVGDTAAVWFEAGSTETVATLHAQRQPDVTGKITAADDKSVTVQVPSRERGGDPQSIEVKLTDRTHRMSGRAEKAELKVGYVASIWLEEGSTDRAAVIQASRPHPGAAGVVTAISADGKTLSLESRGRNGEVIKGEVTLGDGATIEFAPSAGKNKKLKVGQTVSVWFQEGSRETVASVLVELHRKSPDVVGTVTAVSADAKKITVEIRRRGEDSASQSEITLTDKTDVEFAGTDKSEEKPTVGYSATIWLQEGSKDTAAAVLFTKPKERGR